MLVALAQRNLKDSLEFTSTGLKKKNHRLRVLIIIVVEIGGLVAKKQPYEILYSNCIKVECGCI